MIIYPKRYYQLNQYLLEYPRYLPWHPENWRWMTPVRSHCFVFYWSTSVSQCRPPLLTEPDSHVTSSVFEICCRTWFLEFCLWFWRTGCLWLSEQRTVYAFLFKSTVHISATFCRFLNDIERHAFYVQFGAMQNFFFFFWLQYICEYVKA